MTGLVPIATSSRSPISAFSCEGRQPRWELASDKGCDSTACSPISSRANLLRGEEAPPPALVEVPVPVPVVDVVVVDVVVVETALLEDLVDLPALDSGRRAVSC